MRWERWSSTLRNAKRNRKTRTEASGRSAVRVVIKKTRMVRNWPRISWSRLLDRNLMLSGAMLLGLSKPRARSMKLSSFQFASQNSSQGAELHGRESFSMAHQAPVRPIWQRLVQPKLMGLSSRSVPLHSSRNMLVSRRSWSGHSLRRPVSGSQASSLLMKLIRCAEREEKGKTRLQGGWRRSSLYRCRESGIHLIRYLS